MLCDARDIYPDDKILLLELVANRIGLMLWTIWLFLAWSLG